MENRDRDGRIVVRLTREELEEFINEFIRAPRSRLWPAFWCITGVTVGYWIMWLSRYL